MGVTPKPTPESPEAKHGPKTKPKGTGSPTTHPEEAVQPTAPPDREQPSIESTYHALIHAASDGIVMIDEHSRMLSVNPAVERIFGYSAGELLGKELTLLMPEYLRHVHKASLRRYLETGKRHINWEGVELPGRHKDGHEIPLEISFGEAINENEARVFAGVVRDISSRKRAEEALRESEDRYRSLCENSKDGIYSTSVDGRFLSFNQSLIDLLGYSREEFLTLRAQDTYVDPSERSRFQKIMEEEGAVRDHDLRLRRKDGAELHCLVTSTVLRGADGKVAGYQGILRDASAQKWVEALLRQSEEKFRALAETAASAIYLQDGERFRYINPAGEAISGYTRAELLRMSPFDLVHPDFREEVRKRALARLKGESFPPHVEFPILAKSGEVRWLDFRVNVVPYEGRRTILATAFDVTERKRTEEALSESQRALSTVMSNLPGMAYRCRNDRNWTMEFVSEGCLALTGYQPSDFTNGKVSFTELTPPEERNSLWESVQDALRENKPFRVTYHIRTASGDTKRVWEQGRGVFSAKGELLALEGFITDITERERAERLQSALYRIGEQARSAGDLQKLYASIHALLGELMYAKNCYIALHDPVNDVVSFPYFVDEKEPGPAPRKFGRGLTEYVLRTGRPLLAVPEMLEELVRQGEVQRIGAPSLDWMGVPLKTGETTFGALVLQTYEEKPHYGEKEKEILTFVSQQIATAIEQKRREQALRESESKFRAVSETTSGGIFIRRGDRFVYVNSAAELLTGYSREELLAIDHTQIVHPDFRPLLQERSEARLRGEPAPSRYEAKLLSKDGQERWAELTATIIEFEGEPAVLTTTFDITDRKRAEKELAESEAKFRAVAETAAAAIYIHDGAKFLFVNRTAEAISGYRREELLTQHPFDLVHPEHRQMTRQRAEARQRGEPVPTRYDFKILTKSGETRWLDFSASVVQFEGRSAILSMAFDITERKRAEALQSALYRIAEKARSPEALPQLYASIHSILGELMYAKNCYIALYDPATDMVSFPYFVDEKDPPFPPHKFGRGLTEYILRTGEPLLATQEKLDELTRQGEVRRMGAASLDWMGVPLKRGGQTFGALVLQSYQPNIQYGENEKEILTFVSQQIATAIEGKHNEEAIQENESKFRTVAETAQSGIYMYDESGFLYVNPAAERIFGYTRQELLSMEDPWAQLLHSDYRELGRARTKARLRGETVPSQTEFRIITKQGEERWLDFSVGVSEFQGRPVNLATVNDITERKRAEQLQSALYRISEQASTAEDLPQLFASLHAIVGELMYARNFYIALYDEGAGILSFPYFVDEEDVTPAPKKLGKGLTEYVLRTGEPLLASPEVFEDLVRRGEAESVGAPSVDWLGVPLKSGNTTFGVLVVQSYTENVRFNVKQKDILTFVSQNAATAIERKQAQDAVRVSEERYRRVVEVSPDAIYINSQGRFAYVNPAAMLLFRARTAEKLIGTPVMDRVHPDYKEIVRKRIQETTETGGVPLLEEKFIRLDGSEVDVEVVATSLVYQGEPANLVVLREITERKRTEAALRASEERYRNQVHSAVHGIYHASVDEDRFLEVNPALVSMLGYDSAQELLALKFSRDVCANPDERQELIAEVSSRHRIEGQEVYWKRKDGTLFEVRLSGRAVLNQQGEAETYEMIAEDITERRSLEQQLRQSQKMEAVGRLAGGVAHDFNNLLTVIKGYSELMLEGSALGDPLRAEVEEVKKAADRAASLTRQLLAFSRQQVLAPKILDLNEVFGNMEQMLRRLLGEDVELSIALGEELGQVKADPGQIEQVIMNLAVNARDAMPKGGKLILETGNATLDENYMREHGGAKPGRYVMLAVSDTGTGMDEETRSHVFEPFFTTKELGKGTGLGLSTVYGIVKQSEGYIWVYSEPDLGTTFKVYLPRVDEPMEGGEKPPAPLPTHRGAETILLVEDEEGVRALVQQVLTRRGYTVIATRHGQEALEECERHAGPLPLLLTDVVLPEMSGRELAKRLKAFLPGIKVLYMSGYTDDAVLRHGALEKGSAFLQKPFTTEALVSKVQELLDQPA